MDSSRRSAKNARMGQIKYGRCPKCGARLSHRRVGDREESGVRVATSLIL
jgi:hypothetical protein